MNEEYYLVSKAELLNLLASAIRVELWLNVFAPKCSTLDDYWHTPENRAILNQAEKDLENYKKVLDK